MATLEKIRSKGVLLLVVIGLALLAFIVNDFFTGKRGQQGQPIAIMEVNGEAVPYGEYKMRVDEQTQQMQSRMNSTSLSEAMHEQIRQSVYNDFLSEKLIEEATEKVGMAVTPKEIVYLSTGPRLHPIVEASFQNPQTGTVDRSYIRQFMDYVATEPDFSNDETGQMQMSWLNSRNEWMRLEKELKKSQLQSKYATLFMKAIAANSLEAKFDFDNKKNTADITYIIKSYASVPDSTIKISTSDIKKEYDKRKEFFKQDDTREVKYISFQLKPSQDDFDNIHTWINNYVTEFKTTDDVAELVNSVSDIQYPVYNVSENDVDPDFKEFAFSAPKDSVFGPILSGDIYKMARIMENNVWAPDSANVRHIFLSGISDDVTELADSLLNVLKGGANFAELAQQYSQFNTAQQGGELGWMKENNFEKDMIDPIFYSNQKLFTVKANQGIHIFEVLERTPRVKKVNLAVLAREVEPSNITSRNIYDEAKEYLAENNTIEKFESAAQEKGYILRTAVLRESSSNVNNIPNSRNIVFWAFNNNKPTLSGTVYECGNEFVVAALTEVHKKGYASVSEVQDELKPIVMRNKKAEVLTKELTDALQQNKDLVSLATAKSLAIDTLEGVNFGNNRSALGNEYVLLANAPFMTENEVSSPLKGQNGVYVISPFSITESTAAFDDASAKQQLEFMYQYRLFSDMFMGNNQGALPQAMLNALIEKSEIIDNRSSF